MDPKKHRSILQWNSVLSHLWKKIKDEGKKEKVKLKMNKVSENEVNVKEFKNLLYNYIYNYIIKNKNKNKNKITKQTNFLLDAQLYYDFLDVCGKLGLLMGRSKGNMAIEAFMSFMVEKFKDTPKIVQTTLFYKPEINIRQNVEVNIAQKLELKLVKKDLTVALEALEKGKGDKSFYLGMLREAVQRAIKTFNKYEDKELYSLLEKADKWI